PKEVISAPTTIAAQLMKMTQQVIYFLLARKTLVSYQRSIRHLFSETSRINLNWAKFLIYGFIVLVFSFMVIFPLMTQFPGKALFLMLINMTVAVPYIYSATVKGFLQNTIWQVQPEIPKLAVEAEIGKAEEIALNVIDATKEKKERPALNTDKVGELVQKIILLMERDKLYQETELTLQQLAEN